MIILDTNVLSALMQQRPDTPLIQWLDLQPAEMIWVSSITLFEARYEPAEPKRKFPKKLVLSALEQSIDDTGWARLATFGSYLTKLQTDFDSRLYRRCLIAADGFYEWHPQPDGHKQPYFIYLKDHAPFAFAGI